MWPHNPFHSGRALYSRSDWLAATDSVDRRDISVRTRALTSQKVPFIDHVDLVRNSVDYFPPFGGALSIVSLLFNSGS